VKIKVTRYGVIHYQAGCDQCDFSAAIQTADSRRAANVRAAMYKHIRKTGHACWIESGTNTRYEAEQSAHPTKTSSR